MSNSTATESYKFEAFGATAELQLSADVECPGITFSGDERDGYEVVLTHSSMPKAVATELTGATYKAAFELFCRFGYTAARWYEECFRAAREGRRPRR